MIPSRRAGRAGRATLVRLRDYGPADFEALWELDQECFPPGISYSRSELRAFLSRRAAETIVAESEGRILGFVLGWRRHAEGQIITLDVRGSARRRGLGRRLVLGLEGRFGAAGARRVRLEAAVDNTAAVTFYERLGYRRTARLGDYYGPGRHAWVMEKALDGRLR